ncbi:MAG: transposase [Gammaproteobacteria bacterium]|nr:transposase [Gammaproteobacteria bacterium]
MPSNSTSAEFPHGKRLRLGRNSEPRRAYLITTVTYRRMPVFGDFRLGRALVTCMRHHHDCGQVVSLAFVIMPDHLHWLLQLGSDATLPALMRSFKGYSAKRINELRADGAKQLWQAGYHDHAVRREADIRRLARYVVANPLRAGLARNMADYPLWDAIWF